MGNTSSTTHHFIVHYDEPVSALPGVTHSKHVWNVYLTTTDPDGVGWKDIETALRNRLPGEYIQAPQNYVWTARRYKTPALVLGSGDRVKNGRWLIIRKRSDVRSDSV